MYIFLGLRRLLDDLDSGTSTLPGEEDAMIEHDEVIQVQQDSKDLSLGQRDRDLSEVDGVYLVKSGQTY